MSRAFTREPDGHVPEDLPERPVSPHPNWVTPEGFRQIEEHTRQLAQERERAVADQDGVALASTERDLRYWRQRRASAQVVDAENPGQRVRFGSTVTLRQEDGAKQRFKIVGEDEANPAAGLISWVAPVAQALLGREVGEQIEWRGRPVTIIACTTDSPTHH
jgi:transcription elongation GreA/GreB family factor